MKSYELDFEKAMLEETLSYYQAKSKEWRNSSAHYYITQGHKYLKKEEEMCDKMFEKTSRPKVLDVFCRHVLIENAKTVIDQKETGCRFMFDNDAKDMLLSMFTLYNQRIPDEKGIDYMVDVMKVYLNDEGMKIVDK